jgi:hypothetical protein
VIDDQCFEIILDEHQAANNDKNNKCDRNFGACENPGIDSVVKIFVNVGGKIVPEVAERS